MTRIAATATQALLRSLVDYAGTFPPAGLGLREALSSYAGARASRSAWMLGRFVLPASRLREFESLAQSWLETPSYGPWPLSLIMSGDPAEAEEVARFSAAWRGRAEVAALEFRPMEVMSIREAARRHPPGIDVFFEIRLGPEFEANVSEVARLGASVKIRTGGVAADVFPTVTDLVSGLALCATAGVAFKASAGLHHALRGHYALTYDRDSPVATMHGFLNLCLAAAQVRAGASTSEVVAALNETDADALAFDDHGLVWKGQTFSAAALADLRRGFFRSFTSCSFVEPMAELEQMGIV